MRFDRSIAGTAFRVQKLEDFPKRLGVRGVAQECAFAAHLHQVLIPQLVEVVGQGRVRDIEFFLDFSDDQTVGMGGEEQLHDAESSLGAHGRKHIGIFCDLLRVGLDDGRHISIIAEI